MTGPHLSHYRIVSELGKGGMGVVYKAEDTKLSRTVALKLLAPHMLASDADRSRFYREARSAAALHHPNIATVFEIDETADGRPFIAMEYIDGRQLDEGLSEKPLPVEDAVRISIQIAEALKLAHAADIVHRDIKSANVMLTADGVAKVLDFGLAKTDASTKLTQMGSTVGTIAYMSPEQARGEEVDHRTDLWSLGAVLYEMLTGQLPFPGSYEQAVVYGILNADPQPVTALRTGVPMELERIVHKLLSRDPDRRYQQTPDLIADLGALDLSDSGFSRSAVPVAAAARLPGVPAWVWGVAGIGLGAVLMMLWPRSGSGSDEVVHAALPLPDSVSYSDPVWAPDGRRLMVTAKASPSANSHVAEFNFKTGELTRLTPDDGSHSGLYSEDGETRYLGRPGGSLIAYSETGGSVTVLADGFTRGATWMRDGKLGYGRGFDGFATLEIGTPDSDSLRFAIRWGTGEPVRAGNTDVVFYSRHYDTLAMNGAAAFDAATGDTLNDLALPPGRLVLGVVDGRYLVTAQYARGPIGAIPLDLGARQYAGSEQFFFQAGFAALSPQGHLVYTEPTMTGPRPRGEPMYRVDEHGDATRIAGPEEIGANLYNTFSFSPDGSRFVIDTLDRLAVVNVAAGSHGTLVGGRGTFGSDPFWTADGEHIYFDAMVDTVRGISRIRPDGSGQEVVSRSTVDHRGASVSRDAALLVYQRRSATTDWDIYRENLMTGRVERVFVANGRQDQPEVSPDGRWVAFRSGSNVVAVGIDGSEHYIVGEEASLPHWSPEGDALYYLRQGPARVERRTFDPGGSAALASRFGPAETVRSVSAVHVHHAPLSGGDIAIAFPGFAIEESAGPWRVIFNWASTLEEHFN